MKIVITPKVTKLIYQQVEKYKPFETKGALFARKITDELYEIEEVYLEKKVGSITFVKLYNNKKYQNFQEKYHEKHQHDYVNHNYIGDWHSHPLFLCFPSSFDISEVELDLRNSNAKFLIQVIVKVENHQLIGNAFLYDFENSAMKVDLEIQNWDI